MDASTFHFGTGHMGLRQEHLTRGWTEFKKGIIGIQNATLQEKVE